MMTDIKKGVRFIAETDPIIKDLIEKAGPITLTPNPSPNLYRALFRSIVFQQLNGRAAASILSRVEGLFPKKTIFPKKFLKFSDEALRAVGLSKNKTLALRDLSAKAVEGILPNEKELHRYSEEELIEILTEVRGIGPWTVQMLLIFELGRLDVFPTTDFGIQNGFRLAYRKRRLPKPKELERHSKKWKPYRTIAAWYLWRAVDLTRKLPNPLTG